MKQKRYESKTPIDTSDFIDMSLKRRAKDMYRKVVDEVNEATDASKQVSEPFFSKRNKNTYHKEQPLKNTWVDLIE